MATIHAKDGRKILCVVQKEEDQAKLCDLPLMNKLKLFCHAYGVSDSDPGWSMYDAEEEYKRMGIGARFRS